MEPEELETPETVIDPAEAPVIEPAPEPVAATFTQADLDRVRQEAETAAMARYAPAPVAPPASDPDAAIVEMLYSDPTAAIRMLRESVRAETLSQVAPHLQRVNTRDVVQDIAGDLSTDAQQFIGQYAGQIDPQQLNNPVVRDLFRNAAENVARKSASARPSPVAIQPGVRVDEGGYAAANQERALYGLPAITKEEYASLL